MGEFDILKYPRTQHLQGSRLQKGDEDLSQIPFSYIKDRHIVIEEKIDGANTAISFNDKGELLLQSRGHYLTGGNREKHYNLFKQWAMIHKDKLYSVLGTRYIMYGEWLYAKHTVYYDLLPHYFIEFDIYDRQEKYFLDTISRYNLIKDLPVVSAKVLASGKFNKLEDILKYLGNSNYISSNHIENLRNEAIKLNLDPDKIQRETDSSMLMEGLYIKIEENGRVVDRMKYVRFSFLQTVELSESHWLSRPIVPNKLDKDINDLF